ncbi:MAG: hypothetical protein K0S33_4087 [Bacteroidetes bacterium]|jgi:hypothetical protein|nr:hypothetical protein [Bacteroidota bacterium]
MNRDKIPELRLHNQQVSAHRFKTPKELVAHMGIMQSQDYAMSKWAVGLRLKNTTDKEVEAAIHKGEIIRTHVLRPTWHLVSADDVYWMLDLCAARIKALMKTQAKQLELTPDVLKKTNALLEKTLRDNKKATRDELKAIMLDTLKLKNDDNRLGHILIHAELEQIICSGGIKNNKQTYALLPERVPEAIRFSKEESLCKLAVRYFDSHGPATVADFAWWAGLSRTDARAGLASARSVLRSEQVGEQEFWMGTAKAGKDPDVIFLLPAFDEFIISYKDRSASIIADHQKKAFTRNGIFKPVIVVDGKVAGIWKRTQSKNTVHIETEFFGASSKKEKALIEKSAAAYGRFLEKETKTDL